MSKKVHYGHLGIGLVTLNGFQHGIEYLFCPSNLAALLPLTTRLVNRILAPSIFLAVPTDLLHRLGARRGSC